MSNLKYSQEVREKVLHAYLDDGRTTKSLSEEFNIPKATIVYWINEYRKECSLRCDGTVNANAYEELKRLRRQNLELKKENAFLKKAAAFFAKETP